MSSSLGIVVPAFRPDAERLGRYVRALDERLAPETIRIELDDPEPGVVDALAALPATVHAVDRRRGKGAAVTAGFEALATDAYVFVDADGATPADAVAEVVAPVLSGSADVAAGSRRHPDATVSDHQTVFRRLLGDGFAWLARRLLDATLYDYQCGAKAITADAWAGVRDHLYEPGFAWDIEFLAVAAALDYRIAEVPVAWEDKPGSTVSPVRDTLDMARGLFVARHRARLIREDRLHRLLDRGDGAALVASERSTDGDGTGGDPR
ncbi:glycosyltransferase [Haloparvum alkalitolerans]|uniref:glycosyltransferase n=1 Tax=Haloparvum alkalitolerans TaxID=1042953 RepID=UPI003CE92DCF